MKTKSTRRLFLRGVGGYMLSLPILEIMLDGNGEAYAQGGAIEPFYLYTFQGESSGHPRRIENHGVDLFTPPQYGNLQSAFNAAPNDWGNAGLRMLNQMGLLPEINCISNLYINSNNPGSPGNIQVANNPSEQSPIVHRSSSYCVNSGYGCPANVNMWRHYRQGNKHSTDQALYDALGRSGKHINFAIEKYFDGWAQSSSMRNGYIQTPEKDVGKAFDYLFGGFTGAGQTVNVEANQALASRRSILNLVLEDHKRLQKKLGYQDRLLVEQHLTTISELEKDIATQLTEEKELACTIPNRLSENAPINNRNYGGEKERAILFNRMIALAISCGISRVGQYTILRHKAWVNPFDYITDNGLRNEINGNDKLQDLHEVGHYGTTTSLQVWAEMLEWVTGVYGDLIQRLSAVQVGSTKLIDHGFVMMGMHQGIGRSLENSSGNHVHSYENMSYLQAGGKALGARLGRHINGQRKHPVSVANKAVELMGSNITFGEIRDKTDIT
jgi:hypothetical protein